MNLDEPERDDERHLTLVQDPARVFGASQRLSTHRNEKLRSRNYYW